MIRNYFRNGKFLSFFPHSMFCPLLIHAVQLPYRTIGSKGAQEAAMLTGRIAPSR